jgi:hypothetical protein
MKNAALPSSTSARLAARHVDTYETSVRDARTTRTGLEPENLSMATLLLGLSSAHPLRQIKPPD